MAAFSQKTLQPELDAWQREGIIAPEQAARILARYPATGSNPGVIALAIIGSALCITGVSLLIASNWEQIPALLKLAGLFVLLIVSTALAVETQARPGCGRGWWECGYLGAAIFPLLGLALVSQIFHATGRGSDFFLAWMVSIAALPLLSRSVSSFVIFLLAIVAVLCSAQAEHRWFWQHPGGFGDSFLQGCITFIVFGAVCATLSQVWLKLGERAMRNVGEHLGLLSAFVAAYVLGCDVGKAWPGVWLAVFLGALALIAFGYRRERVQQVNLGFWMVGLTVLSTFFRLVGTMFNTALIFIGGGLVIIVCVIVIERLRRRLVKGIATRS